MKNHKMGTELFAEVGDPGSEDTFQARTAATVLPPMGDGVQRQHRLPCWVPAAANAFGAWQAHLHGWAQSEAHVSLPGSLLLSGPVPYTHYKLTNCQWLGRR